MSSNDAEYQWAGDASQPEHFTENMTSQQQMQFPGHTDMHDEVAKGNKSDSRERLFGTHIRESVEIIKDWMSERDH